MACKHLSGLEKDLADCGIGQESGGRFDCCLNKRAAVERYAFDDCIVYEERGLEAGFACRHCGDSVMGVHFDYAREVPGFPS